MLQLFVQPGQPFTETQRCRLLERLVALGLLAGLLCSAPLWTTSAEFPRAPLSMLAITVPTTLHYILFLLLNSALFAVLTSRQPTLWLRISLLLLFLSALLDQMRWQPWVLQYGTLALVLISNVRSNNDSAARVANLSRILIAATYFYSGLQKLNLTFFFSVFPWMLEPFEKSIPLPILSGLYFFGFFVPFIEIAIGIGLLTVQYRRTAITLAACTIGFVLLSLGPFGHSWNSVVWPWNIILLLMILALFYGDSEEHWNWKQIFRIECHSLRDFLNKFPSSTAVLLFVLLPPLSFFNLWDSYPSFALYSGNTNMGYLQFSESVSKKWPRSLQTKMRRLDDGRVELSILNWSMDKVNVPPYPERRVFIRLAEQLCNEPSLASDLHLVLDGRPSWFNSEHPEELDCEGIRNL